MSEKNLNVKLINHTPPSVLEHASFTFAIEGISRVTSHQLVRHRIASYSQQSQRYVREEDELDYIIPEKIKDIKLKDETLEDEGLEEIFGDLFYDNVEKIYKDAIKNCYDKYKQITEELMNDGYDEKEAIEAARYVLPNAAETKIVVTMNVRSLLHFFELRCCNRAQKEIREMAWEMLRKCREVAPIIFENAGPKCVTEGSCPEGDMGCGRSDDE